MNAVRWDWWVGESLMIPCQIYLYYNWCGFIFFLLRIYTKFSNVVFAISIKGVGCRWGGVGGCGTGTAYIDFCQQNPFSIPFKLKC